VVLSFDELLFKLFSLPDEFNDCLFVLLIRKLVDDMPLKLLSLADLLGDSVARSLLTHELRTRGGGAITVEGPFREDLVDASSSRELIPLEALAFVKILPTRRSRESCLLTLFGDAALRRCAMPTC
jgi:hypothetical protein